MAIVRKIPRIIRGSGGELARGGEIGSDVVGNRDGGRAEGEESRLVMMMVMVDDECEEEDRTSKLGIRFY